METSRYVTEKDIIKCMNHLEKKCYEQARKMKEAERAKERKRLQDRRFPG